MLVEFRVKNFRSFKEEQVFSMVAGKDKSLQNNVIDYNKINLLKTTGIYGANASGKTNFILALHIFKEIIAMSALVKPGTNLPVTPFLLNDGENDGITSFELTFIVDDVHYQYGYSLNKTEILEEWLYAYPKGSPQLWFHREKNKDIKFNDTFLKGEKKKLEKVTRIDSLFLSVAAQWNNPQIKNLYDWIHNKIRVIINRIPIRDLTSGLLFEFSKEHSEKLRVFILSSLKKADVGICDFEVTRDEVKSSSNTEASPKPNQDKHYDEIDYNYHVRMIHKTKKGKKVSFRLQEESEGTQRLYEFLGPLYSSAINGFTIIIDEIERSLHPLLTQELIGFFHTNKKSKSQLIYTTHDTVLLNPDIVRRDQVWFTEKGLDGATKLYSLVEYKPRKGEAIQKGYLSGRYGAIPILEKFDLYEPETTK